MGEVVYKLRIKFKIKNDQIRCNYAVNYQKGKYHTQEIYIAKTQDKIALMRSAGALMLGGGPGCIPCRPYAGGTPVVPQE